MQLPTSGPGPFFASLSNAPARPMDDADFIIGLMKTESDALGFIPNTAIRQRWIRQGNYLIQRSRHGPRRGYLLHGPTRRGRMLFVHQVCIDYDWRRRAHATELVRQLINRARRAGCTRIHLRCAADLEANDFWHAMGFQLTAINRPPNRRRRDVFTYLYNLQALTLPPRPLRFAPPQ